MIRNEQEGQNGMENGRSDDSGFEMGQTQSKLSKARERFGAG